MNDCFVIDPDTPVRAPDLGEVPLLKNWDDIVKYFAPLTIDRSRGWDVTPVGEHCWKLVGFYVTVGTVLLRPIVRDENGAYIRGKWVNWYYPGAPNQLRNGNPAYFNAGFSVETKHEEGQGAQLTVTGDHNLAPDHAGPDSVWVAAEPGGPQYSDAVHGLGMRVNTNHLIVNPIFQDVIKTSDKPPPPPPPQPDEDQTEDQVDEPTGPTQNNYFSVVVDGQEIGRIPFNPTNE